MAKDELPTQKAFLANGLVRCTADTAVPPSVTQCGVCLENLPIPLKPFGPGSTPASTVVYLKPCTHFFHHACIIKWHTSTLLERDTCPICRRLLFIADPLTPAQLQRRVLAIIGHRCMPGPHETLMAWETLFMDAAAEYYVRKEIERVHASGGPYHWVLIHELIRSAILLSGGPLRPVFAIHRNYVVLACSSSVYMAIAQHTPALRTEAFVTYHHWLSLLHATLPHERMMGLRSVHHQYGLLQRNDIPVVVVPTSHREMRRSRCQQLQILSRQLSMPQEQRRQEPPPHRSFRERLTRLVGLSLPQRTLGALSGGHNRNTQQSRVSRRSTSCPVHVVMQTSVPTCSEGTTQGNFV
jgi:hypothetical protein